MANQPIKLGYAASSPASWWSRENGRTDRLLMILAVALWFGLVLFYLWPAWAMVIYRLIFDGGVLLLWLIAAAGIGGVILAALRAIDPATDGPALRFSTAAALGLGLFSAATLVLGLAGALNRVTSIALIVLGAICAIFQFARAHQKPRELAPWVSAAQPPARRSLFTWLLLLPVPFVAIMTAGALLPPYMLWNPAEPHGYDVVEYHLQIPREWFEADRIFPLHHNVFSFFPFNVEMHYLLAMHLRGGPWAGMYLATLMHGAMILLAALAAAGLAASLAATRSASRRWPAVLAALAMLTTPWLAQLGAITYDEGGFLLFGVLSLGWAARAIADATRRRARFILAGVMAGFACGTKLTAVPEILVAGAIAALILMLAVAPDRPISLARRAAGPVLFGLAGLLCFSPWLIRTWAWSGNPVFPELSPLLGQGDFSDVQVQRWKHAHAAQSAERSVAARVKALGVEVFADWQFGFVLVPLGILAIVLHWREPDVRFLGAMLFLLAIFWLGFTHLQSRFFILAVPICALLIARLPPEIGVVLVVQAVLGFVLLNQKFLAAIDRIPVEYRTHVVGTENLSWMTPAAAEQVPPAATLTLVGDAKAFLYQRPMSLLRYRTVFDADTSAGRGVIEAWAGKKPAHQPQWLLIDPQELQRFERTYQPFPPLPPEIAQRSAPYLIKR